MDRDHLKELFDAPNSSLDFFEAALEDIDFRYTFRGNSYNLYHVPVIRNQLTRGIAAFLPSIAEEIKGALEDDIDPLLSDKGDVYVKKVLLTIDWAPIHLYEKTLALVARISYRAFIGSSVCLSPS